MTKVGYNKHFVTSLRKGWKVEFPILDGKYMWSAASKENVITIKVWSTKPLITNPPSSFAVSKEYLRSGKTSIRCRGGAKLFFEDNAWYFEIDDHKHVSDVRIEPVYIEILSK